MKTRSNMPLFVVECEDVKALSNTQIDLLRCGDYLVKKDASGEHAYKVTYKSATGMCLTYYDASVIETQSYDKINGVWTYNSEDKTPNLLDLPDDNDIKALAKEVIESAPEGTIDLALGLDENGDLVSGAVSGGSSHCYLLNMSGNTGTHIYNISFLFITENEYTTINSTELGTELNAYGCKTLDKYYPCSGNVYGISSGTENKIFDVRGLYTSGGSTLKLVTYERDLSIDFTNSTFSFSSGTTRDFNLYGKNINILAKLY